MPVMPMLFLSSMFRRRLPHGTPHRCDALPGAALCCLVRGEALLSIEGAGIRAKANEWFLLRPGQCLEANAIGADAEYILLFVRGFVVNSRTGDASCEDCAPWERLAPEPSGRLPLPPEPTLVQKLAALQETYRQRDDASFLLNVRFQELLGSIAERLLPARREAAAASAGGIEQSVDFIHRNYMRKIRLETLADIAGFTPTSFSREFKKTVGCPPIEYVNELRIAKAKKLLLDRRNTIKHVSALSGFGSEFYFSRMFRKSTGVSPTVYMRRNDLRIAVASSFRYEDLLRSLGVTPVAAIQCRKHRLMDENEHRRLIRAGLAELRDAKPDLVLCDPWHLSMLEESNAAVPALAVRYSMDWRLIHRDIAEAIGREEAAFANLSKLEQRADQARIAMNRRFGRESFTFMRVMDRLIRIQGAANHPLNVLLYEDVGLRPGYCVHTNLMHVEYSAENYPNLGTDHLIVQEPASADDTALYGILQQSAAWQSIRAVADRRVYDAFDWVGLSWSPLGRMRILDELLRIAGSRDAREILHG